MDSQDHKKSPASAGHEVHLCHRCGWPFPNPHPSARHRRAHKRVCGAIEGYKISESDLVISDDEHASDEDEHTPSPKVEKRYVKEPGSGGVGQKSNKSEDDLFSDAATEFSKSGISPSLEEHFEVKQEIDKKIEQASVESNFNTTQLKKVDDFADTTEQPNDPASTDQIEIDQSRNVIPVNDAGGKEVSLELDNCLQSDVNKSESQRRTEDIQLMGDKLASVCLGSEEGKTSGPAVTAVDKSDELCDQLDKNARISAASNLNAVEDKPELEGDKVFLSLKEDSLVTMPTSGEDVKSSVLNDHLVTSSDHIVSSNDAEIEPKYGLSGTENANVSEGEKCAMNNHDEKFNSMLWVAGNESCKGGTLEAASPVLLDSTQESVNSTVLLSSGDVDGDSRPQECLSQNNSSLPEQTDNDFLRSHQGFEEGKDTEVLHSVGSAGLNHDTGDVAGVHSVNVDDMVVESNDKCYIESSEKTPERQTSKDLADQSTRSVILVETSDTDNSCTNVVSIKSESVEAAKLVVEPEHNRDAVVLPEICTPPVHEKGLNETESVSTVAGEESTCNDNVAMPNKCFAPTIFVDQIPSPLESKALREDFTNDDDKKINSGDNAPCVGSKPLQDTGDDNLIIEKYSVSAMDLSHGSSSITESLEGKWGSISVAETNSLSSPKSETNMENSSKTTDKGHDRKSDDFEAPSFMTLVQSEDETNKVAAPDAAEIETVKNNQHPKSASLQAGWFPSLTHVVNESQGRKKNEEIIAKVTNWSMGKEHHNQLKNLMDEAKPPNSKQVPDKNSKDEASQKDNNAGVTTVGSVFESEAPKVKPSHEDDWNSPARYPAVIKKEKKKGKPYWVPFVCCSSVNRDL